MIVSPGIIAVSCPAKFALNVSGGPLNQGLFTFMYLPTESSDLVISRVSSYDKFPHTVQYNKSRIDQFMLKTQ
jgi:hypothetical protein